MIKLERLLVSAASKLTETSFREMYEHDVFAVLERVPEIVPRVVEAQPGDPEASADEGDGEEQQGKEDEPD